ncbi:AAA family ATPase [Chitinophaga barathri]|uniref:ATP-binding protein n=1 Tax=Chitinophaga barathri TaxID=1647451 RepID=A0A3N4MIJ7_9BACT|nr:AAA family ATPase [Chitinophaga barathri]RPD43275.1 ATP-binding protein [Chitinophaga barathri]
MEAVIFCGIQATGKTTFFKNNFFSSHMRISLDQLKSRYREDLFLEACLKSQQPFVIDNTNPAKEDRQKYIRLAKDRKFRIVGYYFQSKVADALERNSLRTGKALVPDIAIKGTFNKLELPSLEEGFDELYYVSTENNDFVIKPWTYEI